MKLVNGNESQRSPGGRKGTGSGRSDPASHFLRVTRRLSAWTQWNLILRMGQGPSQNLEGSSRFQPAKHPPSTDSLQPRTGGNPVAKPVNIHFERPGGRAAVSIDFRPEPAWPLGPACSLRHPGDRPSTTGRASAGIRRVVESNQSDCGNLLRFRQTG